MLRRIAIQIDYLDWLYKWGIYAVMIIGSMVILLLARSRFARMRDSDKLATPSYEEMESGVVISVEDDDDP